MGAATVTKTEYGFMVTGDTGAVTVNSGTLRVKALAYAGDDNDDVATLTTLKDETAVSCYKFKAMTDDDSSYQYAYFGENGVPMTGLAVTINDSGSYVYIFIN